MKTDKDLLKKEAKVVSKYEAFLQYFKDKLKAIQGDYPAGTISIFDNVGFLTADSDTLIITHPLPEPIKTRVENMWAEYLSSQPYIPGIEI